MFFIDLVFFYSETNNFYICIDVGGLSVKDELGRGWGGGIEERGRRPR